MISNLIIRPGPISSQPGGTHHLNNTFTPLSGENIIRQYECEEGCSRCCGQKTFIAVTNTRVIARHQEPNRCVCCCEGSHIDMAIYLRDIEVLKEHTQKSDLLTAILLSCITCSWPCLLLSICCGLCCCDQPKYIGVKGGFGFETLTFKASDAIYAANEISGLIQPFKNRA